MGLTSKAEIEAAFEQLRSHNLLTLFTQHLGWSAADTYSPIQVLNHSCIPIAQRNSVVVWHVPLTSNTRFAPLLRHQTYQTLLEKADDDPLVIFSTADKRRSLWCSSPDESALYVVGQPMSLWLFRLRRFEKATQGLFPCVTSEAVQDETFESLAKDIERGITGIESAADRQRYSLLVFQRLIFLQQLQQKGWLDSDTWYLQTRFGKTQEDVSIEQSSYLQYKGQFFLDCLQPLFRALSLPKVEKPMVLLERIGQVPSVGLFFQKCELEEKYTAVRIEDSAFENVLGWLSEQTSADTLNPWMSGALGYWLERYWRQTLGITPAEVGPCDLDKAVCDCTLDELLLARLNTFTRVATDKKRDRKRPKQQQSENQASMTLAKNPPVAKTLNDVLFEATPQVCRYLIQEVLPSLRMVDLYCGSGQLLMAFHQRLTEIFSILSGYIQQNQDAQLKIWHSTLAERPATYSLETSAEDTGIVLKNIQERVLKNTIFGVAPADAVAQSARFLLLLHFVSTAQTLTEVESLIDLDFNVMAGDPLVGFVTVDEERFDQVNTSGAGSVFQGNLLQPLAADSYQTILDEKNIALEYYQSRSQTLAKAHHIPSYARAALLREEILTLDQKAQQKLDNLLLSHMSQQLGLRYRETQLSDRPIRRPLTIEDIQALNPFHCGYHFNSIIRKGGFDIVVCMPPWGAFKPTTTEFVLQHRDLAAREGLTVKTLKTSKQALKQLEPDVAQAWLDYQDYYAYLTSYFEQSELYCHQRSNTEGKKNRRSLDREMLFVEQCFNLIADRGMGGVVVPAEMLTDDRVRSLLNASSVSMQMGEVIGTGDETTDEIALLSWIKSVRKKRKPGLHPGAFVMSEDFDDPLPDSFWLGEE